MQGPNNCKQMEFLEKGEFAEILNVQKIVKMRENSIYFNSPIYCMDNYKCPSFLPRETSMVLKRSPFLGLSPQLVVTGGGGKAKSGVKNFIVCTKFMWANL